MLFARSVGSHKANFTMHPAFLRKSEEEILDLSAPHSPLIAGYDCPAGSAIFFTEALCQYVQSPLALLAACGCVQRQISSPPPPPPFWSSVLLLLSI
jgi:hypothetical protein